MSVNKVGGPGSYNAICDVCGLKFKASELSRRWDGMMVDKACYEPRHPQEFVRAINDVTKLPFIRVDSDGIDVGPTYDCSTFEFETYLNITLTNILAPLADTDNQQTYTINKVRTYGGAVHIPDGLTVHVNCTFTIGT